jgi:hypothetical protein
MMAAPSPLNFQGGSNQSSFNPAGMDRSSAIKWAVSRLTADEARGKVALLSEELKQMKLMTQEIRVIKDALRSQHKEIAQATRAGAALQDELKIEQERRLALARSMEKAISDFPLLDPQVYNLTPEDMVDEPLLPMDEADGEPSTTTPAAPDSEPEPEPEPELPPQSPAGAKAAAEVKKPATPVVDDLLSLIMSNTTVGQQHGIAAAPPQVAAPFWQSAPAVDPFLMPVATVGGQPVQMRAVPAMQQSPVLLQPPPDVPANVHLSPFGSQIAPNVFKSSTFSSAGYSEGRAFGTPGAAAQQQSPFANLGSPAPSASAGSLQAQFESAVPAEQAFAQKSPFADLLK